MPLLLQSLREPQPVVESLLPTRLRSRKASCPFQPCVWRAITTKLDCELVPQRHDSFDRTHCYLCLRKFRTCKASARKTLTCNEWNQVQLHHVHSASLMSCLVVKTQRKSAKCRQVNVAPINSGGWLLLQPAKAFGANDTCPWSAKPRKKNENDMSLSQRSCTVRVTPCLLYGIISASCCTKWYHNPSNMGWPRSGSASSKTSFKSECVGTGHFFRTYHKRKNNSMEHGAPLQA